MADKTIARLVLVLAMLAGAGCTAPNDKTNDIYLIPEGYEGIVYAFYNVKNAPALTKEGDYDVYPINEKGYFVTSTPDMDYGLVTDKYYYVDQKGQRTPIQDDCVRTMGTGSVEKYTGDSEKAKIKYTGLEVTNTKCGRAFQDGGDGLNPEYIDPVINEILTENENASN